MDKLKTQEMELLRAHAGATRKGHLRHQATEKEFGEVNVVRHTEKCRLQ